MSERVTRSRALVGRGYRPTTVATVLRVSRQALHRPIREVLGSITQDYVYNWVRDAAIVIAELDAADLSLRPDLSQAPDDAASGQSTAPDDLDRAKYTVTGGLVDSWPRQKDGPA